VAVGEIIGSAVRPVPKGYDTYVNARFGYSVAYPHGILFPQGESENGDGQHITSKHRDVDLAVWGSLNTLDETTKDLYKEFKTEGYANDRASTTLRITYAVVKKNWLVVSGYEDGKVVYYKAVLDKDGEIGMTFVYPIKEKAQFDPIAAKITASFARSSAPPMQSLAR